MLKKSILLVDDDETLRTRLVRAFSDRGYESFGAGDFDSAASAMSSNTPDFAVIDLRLGGGDSGLEVLREIRRRGLQTKVVMLTGFGSIPVAVEATRLGIEDFISKPADVENLLLAFGEVEKKPSQTEKTVLPPLPSLKRLEWEHIQRALHLTEGNISQASALLKIPRRSLQRKLQRTQSGS